MARLTPELRGVLITLLAMLIFGLMDAASKYLSTRYPTAQIIWLRFIFTIPLVVLVLGPRASGQLLRSARPWLQVLRSLLRSLGYDDVVEEFDKAINWFA